MALLTGITGAVRAGIAGAANQAIRAGTNDIRNIAGLNREGNNSSLGSVFGANQGTSSNILTYPINVDSDPQQGHYIMFMINERIPGKVAKNKNAKGLSEAQKKVIAEQNLAFEDSEDYEPPIENMLKSTIGSAGGKLNRSIVMEKLPTQRLKTTIALYMPPSVSVTYNVKYGDQEIGALAGIANAAIDAFKGAGDGATTKIKAVLQAATGNVGKEALTSTLNSTIDTIAPGAQALQQLSSGTVITPRMEMMFEGVGRRNFQYSFSFLPKSVQEARLVEDIIYHFKFYMMPEYANKTTRREMKIPGTFDIRYMYRGSENNFLNKVSTCFLTNVSVEYGADRFTAYEPTSGKRGSGPPPQKSKITLDFTELEVLSQDHIKEGF